MAEGEKETKAARTASEEALEEAATAAKCCKEAEARLKAFQAEQSKLTEQLRVRDEELAAHKAKVAAREGELSQEKNLLGAKHAHLNDQEKEIASRKTLLDAKGEALVVAEKKKATELVDFPDVELRLRTALRTLCRDRFDEPLTTPESGFAVLTAELAMALEDAFVQADKILDNECRGLFFEAATHILSHLHLHETGFGFGSVIQPVPTEARHNAVEVVKGPMEALVKRFARVAGPSSPDDTEADDGEDDASDANDKPPEDGATSGGRSS
ncbi:hypothetical protein D1007_25395 [Hordeum vulgare]|nr:hypothetical protein D1007_25395 [Hordeum vulgare]